MLQLLSPDVRAIAIAARTPQRDRAPDWLAAGTPARLRDDLVALLGSDRVLSRPIDLVRYASDASPYRLFPKVVVIAQNVEDVRKALAYARRHQESVTFRAAGTSLSGQAQGDGMLIDVRRHWAGVEVENGGRRLRARPGTILARANLALHRSWLSARSRPGQRLGVHHRRRRSQQFQRHVLRDHAELL